MLALLHNFYLTLELAMMRKGKETGLPGKHSLGSLIKAE